MSIASRRELIRKVKERYLKAKKRQKTTILDELVENVGLRRNYLIQILSAKKDLSFKSALNRKSHCRYDGTVIAKCIEIWKTFDYPCGQRFKPMMEEYIRILEKWKEVDFSKDMKEKLLSISSATLDRRLKKTRHDLKRKLFSTTRPGTMLKKEIPIRTSSWDEKRLGYGELDTVSHGGASASGEFVWSLTFTDILSQWTESVAVLGKSRKNIDAGLDIIELSLPFPLLGIDPDNGSEFINWQLYRKCEEKHIDFTRGRPYMKNDNAHIEQKNWTHVRKLAGYKRLDTEEKRSVLHDLYRNEWRAYKNFFIPNKKLIEKKRVEAKIVKRYDVPKTPYQRLLECEGLSEERKSMLRALYDSLNPVELKRSIERKLKDL
jgi:hypothetical protein